MVKTSVGSKAPIDRGPRGGNALGGVVLPDAAEPPRWCLP